MSKEMNLRMITKNRATGPKIEIPPMFVKFQTEESNPTSQELIPCEATPNRTGSPLIGQMRGAPEQS